MTARWIPSLVFGGYRAATSLAQPLIPFYLKRRVAQGKEEPARLDERFGRASRPRPDGPLIWAHGASIGEMLAILPLLGRLRARGFNVLLTSGTVTSARLAERRLPEGAFHQFTPLDTPTFVRRFLDHWHPDLVLVAESELWPNMILETTDRDIPVILLNGRMSERSFRRWRMVRSVSRAMLSRIDLCLAQSPADAERFEALGAPRVFMTSNLKYDTPPPQADPMQLSDLRARLSGRPVLLAAATHRGEEAAVLAAHRELSARLPGLMSIIVPRHPERGDEVVALATEAGLLVTQRSRKELPDRGIGIYVADTIGELGLFYRLCPIVFVGGSLVKHGGQNPIEPAKLECAILHGPHVFNFAEVYGALNSARAAATVTDTASLTKSFSVLLDQPERVRSMAQDANRTVSRFTGALERTLTALDPYLMQLRLAGR